VAQAPVAAQWRAWPAALALTLLAPAMGELLSGSSPPAEYFRLAPFLTLWLLYGVGALLVREGAILFGGGWHRVLLLGAAYGIIEEGLFCRSFFDPNWPDLGPLANYGRWGGFNAVWSLHLTIYHAFFSIAAPILLVELAWPQGRGRLWTSRGWRGVLFALFLAEVMLLAGGLTKYMPSDGLLLGAEIAAGAFVFLAWWWPELRPVEAPRRLRRPLFFWAVGFAMPLVFFAIFYATPSTQVPAAAEIAGVLLLLAFTMGWLYLSTGGGKAWGDLHRLGLVGGVISMFILLSAVQQMDPKRKDSTTGMAVVGAVFLVGLLVLWARVRRAAEAEVAASPAPGSGGEG
jgi:hypothetical protein